MERLYAVYKNNKIMLNGNNDPITFVKEEDAMSFRSALYKVAQVFKNADTFKLVCFAEDRPVVAFRESDGTIVNPKPTPKDFTAGISDKSFAYACKHFGMNPVEVNNIRSSEQWAEIIELAKDHASRPWNVTIDSNNSCNLTPIQGVKPQLSEHTEDEVEEMLRQELGNKIERTSSKVPTKEVWGIYSRDDKPVTSEFHRDGQHVLFLTQKMAEDYVHRIENFIPFGVFSKKKVVPVTQKVIGDGLS